ncbi:MAG: type II secretion system protein [Deltaproteobacteria bacterium]|nr:type II secretion system protein [Deltaproteobacteria bacterium]
MCPTTRTIALRVAGGRARGFTMVELLAVVTMVGILAAVAIVGYRRYLNAAHSGEAKNVVGAIRVAESSYKAETLGYLGCSATLAAYYPAAPDGKKRNFNNPGHPDSACWQLLNVSTDTPTLYGFSVVAGSPGAAPPVPDTALKPTWPAPTTEPWYVIQAAGDIDANGAYSYFLSSSFSGEIYDEEPTE